MAEGPPTILVIGGPTASGKSALAAAAAERFGGVVVNADSMQLYRDLPILTSWPDEELRARAPHRLYGVLDGAERCSAGRWRALAMAEIERAQGDGALPILVGGTGLYLRALLEGLAPVPRIPEAVREAVRRLYEREGGAGLHARLAARDPEAAGRLEPARRPALRPPDRRPASSRVAQATDALARRPPPPRPVLSRGAPRARPSAGPCGDASLRSTIELTRVTLAPDGERQQVVKPARVNQRRCRIVKQGLCFASRMGRSSGPRDNSVRVQRHTVTLG